MKKSRLTDSQIIEARGRAEYGGMDAWLMARMKELEAKNATIARWLLRLTDAHRTWGFGLFERATQAQHSPQQPDAPRPCRMQFFVISGNFNMK